jgi:hypothetical protein
LVILFVPLLLTADATQAATTYSWQLVPTFNDWPVPISDDDVLEGRWTDANTIAGGLHWQYPTDGRRLTDGQLGSPTDSVLLDFSSPSLHIRYNLLSPVTLMEVRTFGGDPNKDGRVFQNVDFEYKDADGIWHELLHEAHTGPYYVSNAGRWEASLIRVFDNTGGPLLAAEQIYGLGFKFWLVDRGDDLFLPRDDQGVSIASIIKEIDAIAFDPLLAWKPNPYGGQTGVNPHVVLSWVPGIYAGVHDVYLGTDFDDVNDANTTVYNPNDVYKGHYDVNSFAPSNLELGQTYYWRVDEVNDVCAPGLWKGPVWNFTVIPLIAWDPKPADGATLVAHDTTLSWKPGAYTTAVDSHDIYLGTNLYAVTNATISNPLGVYKGRQDANSFDPDDLKLATTYYWRIDQVNDPCVFSGSVWNFRIIDYLVVDDFESYVNDDDLKDTWQPSGNGVVQLEQASGHSGSQSMSIEYGKSGNPYYIQTIRTFDTAQDATASGIKALDLWFRGKADSEDERLYVALEDTDVNRTEIEHPDPDLQNETWRVWRIDLQDFTGVTLANVKKITVGIGDGVSPAGYGYAYFDDIRLYPARCISAPARDLNNDCVIDFRDFALLADGWLETGMWP